MSKTSDILDQYRDKYPDPEHDWRFRAGRMADQLATEQEMRQEWERHAVRAAKQLAEAEAQLATYREALEAIVLYGQQLSRDPDWSAHVLDLANDALKVAPRQDVARRDALGEYSVAGPFQSPPACGCQITVGSTRCPHGNMVSSDDSQHPDGFCPKCGSWKAGCACASEVGKVTARGVEFEVGSSDDGISELGKLLDDAGVTLRIVRSSKETSK